MRLVSLIFLVACAKNVARDEALSRANAAKAKGDYVGEAIALRDACTFAPDETDLCKRADQAWGAAQERSRQAAKQACTNIAPTLEGVDRCLAAVTEIRKLAPDHPDATALAEAAAKQHLARCFADSPSWQTSIEAAVELVRCEEARAPQIALASYMQQVHAARTNARDQLMRLADHPAYADRTGALSELTAAATCLTPTPDLVERARATRTAFIERARATIELRATSQPALPELCTTAAGMLPNRAACGRPRAGAPTVTVIGDIEIAPVEHTAYETQESKDYVAGIIRFPNPDYQPAVNEERNARQSKDSAEQQLRRDESDCRSAESSLSSASSCSSCPERSERDRACNAKSSSESLYRSRTMDWESARRRLESTPQIKERDDIRTAHYIVKHHTWSVGWSAQLRNEGSVIPAQGGAQTTDLETSGAAVAGVPADPVTYPGNRWFVGTVRDQVAAKVAETVDAALQRRAADLSVKCPAPLQWSNDWLDCWARVRLWAAGKSDLDPLLRLVGMLKDQRRGPLWDHVRCTQ
jgi:hypothetical protein